MALRAAALLLALWSPPADAQLRGQAPAPPPVDTAAEVDHRTSSVRIIGHNLLLTGGIEHFYEVFGFANETMHNESGCFSTAGMNYTIEGNFTGNTSEVRNQYGRSLQGEDESEEEPDPYLRGVMANLTLGDYAWCCLNNDNATEGFKSVRRLQSRDWEANTTLVTCYRNETRLEAKIFEFEKEEEDLVRSHWENFQHPKPTVLYEQLSKNLREEIRNNFIRTQTVKYEHDVVKESLHNESVRVKTLLEAKKLQNRRKMDLLFARHKSRVSGLHKESARVLDELEDKRRETSDHLADLKEDHLATVAALTQNAREVDEHLRVKTEEHMDAMTNYYQRWHDNHEDAEETILNLRRSNGRVGEGVEDAAEFYFGNPEPLFNESTGNSTNATSGGGRRLQAEELGRSGRSEEGGYEVISLDDEDDDYESQATAMPRIRPSIDGVSSKATSPSSDCIAFRQTAGCDSHGPREAHGDDSCAASIRSDRSGYCECRSGRLYRVNCGHAAFTCAAACESGAATEDVSPADDPAPTPQHDEQAERVSAAERAMSEAAAAAEARAQRTQAARDAEETASAPAASSAATAEEAVAETAPTEAGPTPAAPSSADVAADPLYAGVSDPNTPGWKPRLGRAPKITGRKPAVTPTKVGKKPAPEVVAAETPPPEPAVTDAKADTVEQVVEEEAASDPVEEKASAEAQAAAQEAAAVEAEQASRRNVERLLRDQLAAREAAKAADAPVEEPQDAPEPAVAASDAVPEEAKAAQEEQPAPAQQQEEEEQETATATGVGGDGAAVDATVGADVAESASDGADAELTAPGVAASATQALEQQPEQATTEAEAEAEAEAETAAETAAEAAAEAETGAEGPTPLPDPTPPPMERLMEALRAKQAEAAAKQAAAKQAAAAAAADLHRQEPTERLAE